MSLSITFFDKIKYKSTDFISRDADFFGSGVVNLTDFPLTYPSPANMTVNVGQGTAYVNGYRVHNDANTIALTISTADTTNPRIDIIQVGYTSSLDGNGDTTGSPVIQVKQGVAQATPIEPGADPGFVKLYAINVAANVTSITSSNVTDRRSLVPLNVTGTQISMGGALSNSPGSVTDTNIGNRTADPTQVPTGLTGTLTNWLSWITNRIKAITGKTNWYDAPDTTLAAANTHMNNTNNPHNVTATQVGAITTTTYNNQVNQDVRSTASPTFVTVNANLNGNASSASSVPFSGVTSKPTTLSGYGITDAMQAISGGYKVQSGSVSISLNGGSKGSTSATFPTVFSSTPNIYVSVANESTADDMAYAWVTSPSSSSCTINAYSNSTNTLTITWLAIGS